jgi:hypothetical protein
VKHIGLLFIIAVFPLLAAPGAGAAEHEPGISGPVNFEVGRLWNTGVGSEKIFSDSVRFLLSTHLPFPLHSSLEFGLLNPGEARKFIRFNVVGVGFQPSPLATRTKRFESFARADVISGTMGDGGYYAFSPSLEMGVSLLMAPKWAALLSLRQSIDAADPKSSLTSICLALGAILGGD